ncbi:hypothetical protein DF268_01120 [Streptomyces sp. V2]|nr:hypothetical protein DF268_01120 [Streptomyces sp. V2]
MHLLSAFFLAAAGVCPVPWTVQYLVAASAGRVVVALSATTPAAMTPRVTALERMFDMCIGIPLELTRRV